MRQNYHHRSGNLTALLKRCPARSDEWNRAIKLGIHDDDDDDVDDNDDDGDNDDDMYIWLVAADWAAGVQ